MWYPSWLRTLQGVPLIDLSTMLLKYLILSGITARVGASPGVLDVLNSDDTCAVAGMSQVHRTM